MRALQGKAIAITGAGGGLGAAYARFFSEQGARLVVNDIDAAAAESVAEAIRLAGGECYASAGDVSVWDDAEALVACCVDRFGSLDGFVNNAAVMYLADVYEENPDRFRRTVEVDFIGTSFCGIHALRQMFKQGKGSLLNSTSGAQMGKPFAAAYSGSKGAIASLTYSWAIEAQGTGVRVNGISPNAYTALSKANDEYAEKKGLAAKRTKVLHAEENAPVACYLLSDHSSSIHGQIVRVQGGEISLMTHPAVLVPSEERVSWDFEAVKDAFEQNFVRRQMPVGPAALEIVVKPYTPVFRGGG